MEMPTVSDASRLIRTGRLSAEELTASCLDAIERANPDLNAFVYVDAEGALGAAKAVDAAVRDGRLDELGPLAGVPFGVKDLEDCAGMPTTHASRWFADDPVKTSDSIHVGRLRAAGAIPVGKTATPEFGSWAYTASPLLGVTRNPWDHSRTPGGSSGGTAAAVVGGHGAVRHRERRRRFDPHSRELHRPRRVAVHLRAHPDPRRHDARAELGERMSRDDRRRHRVVARRDGRTRRA